MDNYLHRTSFWWIIVLFSLSALSESTLVYERGSANLHFPSRTYGDIQPPSAAVKQQLSARPRPIVVNCHSDSMEVVVQADMFDRGVQVDGGHLRLGSDSESEGGACGAAPSGEAQFTLRTHLLGCGTKLSVSVYLLLYDAG